jgi:hypothetical protein
VRVITASAAALMNRWFDWIGGGSMQGDDMPRVAFAFDEVREETLVNLMAVKPGFALAA